MEMDELDRLMERSVALSEEAQKLDAVWDRVRIKEIYDEKSAVLDRIMELMKER